MVQVGILVPTLNAGCKFTELLESIGNQTVSIHRKLVIDSGSSDDTVSLAKKYQFEVLSIDKASFNHGGTRQLAVDYLEDIDIAVYLTQDAILQDEYSVANLIQPFGNKKVGAAYGRQLSHRGASPFATQARLFNYPESSQIRSYADKKTYGMKTAFMSNSFAAYRVSSLQAVGGFPNHVIVSEDMYVAARMLMKNYLIAYAADACAYHSHDYSISQELKRYFDIGVFHSREPWIRQEFGNAEGEGLRFVKEQFIYLYKKNYITSIPQAILANVVKLVGYRLGVYEKYLPKKLQRILSAQSYFFK